MQTAASCVDALEPAGLVRSFLAHPPLRFRAECTASGVPFFVGDYDLLTTADEAVRRRLPKWRWLARCCTVRATFAGTTVTEYVQMPHQADARSVVRELLEVSKDCTLLVVKDLPVRSPLLTDEHNAQAESLRRQCLAAGFTLVAGQALAYVPIDFSTLEGYLAARSAGRRRDLRRKLRSRERLHVECRPTGDSWFDSAAGAQLYALYLNVHAQSEVHFDLLSPEFFNAVFRDGASGGIVFLYHHAGELVGFNLCYRCGDKLVDKYIGMKYPQARELNLYFVSWLLNLEYCLAKDLKFYVAGWTDAQVKRELGARFTWTEHAVYPRSPLLRFLLRLFRRSFESDANWQRGRHDAQITGA